MNIAGWGLVSWKQTMRELKTYRMYKDVLAETMLTFIFITLVTQASLSGSTYVASLPGFCVTALVESYNHIAPSLFNPNLVLVLVFSRRMSIPKGILYIAVEMLMAMGAVTFIYEISPDTTKMLFGPPGPVLDISDNNVWVCEFIAVFFFASVLLGAIDDERKSVRIPQLAIGFCVVGAHSIGAPFGVTLNPLVSFGFSFVTDDWTRSWVYWTAGPAGSIVATILYYFFAYDGGKCGNPEEEDEDSDTLELSNGKVNAAFVNDSIATIEPL